MYYLKLFDETLITFEMERKLSLKIFNINVVSENKKLFPEILQNHINSENIEEFLKQRIVPKNRAFVDEILRAQDLTLKDIKGVIDICKGLSLNDCYWVTDNETMKFEDYNLYDNNFSTTLSLIAFTGYTSKIKGIATSPEFTTNGALPKAWRRIDNKVYLYKGSTEGWNFSNTGYEPYSEYYATQIAETMEINAVKYDLNKWKGMLASVCELFTNKQYSYVPIYLAAKTDKIDEIYKWCCKNDFQGAFSNMIAFDSVILNQDRHLANFGVLKDNTTGEYVSLAPIFDNGEGLLSKGDIKVFNDDKEFNKYIQNVAVNTSCYGVDYKELVKAFCGKEQIAKLRKLLNFNFKKHSKYNLPEQRLKLLEGMIQTRARELINEIEKETNKRKTISEIETYETTETTESNITLEELQALLNERQIDNDFGLDEPEF